MPSVPPPNFSTSGGQEIYVPPPDARCPGSDGTALEGADVADKIRDYLFKDGDANDVMKQWDEFTDSVERKAKDTWDSVFGSGS